MIIATYFNGKLCINNYDYFVLSFAKTVVLFII